jgi:hypothetical protein
MQPDDPMDLALRCPGNGQGFRPYPCGRDEDHAAHPVGQPPDDAAWARYIEAVDQWEANQW